MNFKTICLPLELASTVVSKDLLQTRSPNTLSRNKRIPRTAFPDAEGGESREAPSKEAESGWKLVKDSHLLVGAFAYPATYQALTQKPLPRSTWP